MTISSLFKRGIALSKIGRSTADYGPTLGDIYHENLRYMVTEHHCMVVPNPATYGKTHGGPSAEREVGDPYFVRRTGSRHILVDTDMKNCLYLLVLICLCIHVSAKVSCTACGTTEVGRHSSHPS